MQQSVAVIGGGFSGLSVACYLSQAGYNTTIYEKHATPGGRARSFESQGFRFDMGPSWYWMPDVFERFFSDFGLSVKDQYALRQLDPSFRIFFGRDDLMSVPRDSTDLKRMLERLEPGSGKAYDSFMLDAKQKYDISMQDLIFRPCLSIWEFFRWSIIKRALQMHLFRPFHKFVGRYFQHPQIRQLIEFPVLFLGATAQKTPALYSMMSYAGLELGTWYPEGGMFRVIQAMEDLARSLNVDIVSNATISQIETADSKAIGVRVGEVFYPHDLVVSSADYHYTEQRLLPFQFRNYSEEYWAKKVMAPSCLIFYLGVNTKIDNLEHHNLFFDRDFVRHAEEIYTDPKWPTDPLFYVCCPSKTDQSVAPANGENLFILMPLASGVNDTDALREAYFTKIMGRLESLTKTSITPHIILKKSYCLKDFVSDYGAFRGNAYGLANILRQTAILKPSIKNKHLPNLYYTGQLTVPGPGMPPALISGKIVSQQICKEHPLNKME